MTSWGDPPSKAQIDEHIKREPIHEEVYVSIIESKPEDSEIINPEDASVKSYLWDILAALESIESLLERIGNALDIANGRAGEMRHEMEEERKQRQHEEMIANDPDPFFGP